MRFGYSRYRTSFGSLDGNRIQAASEPRRFPLTWARGNLACPKFDFGGIFENLGASGFSIPRGRTSQSFQILDNFTWLKGTPHG